MAETATGATLQCVVVTPEKAVLDEAASFVVLPMFDGEYGILPRHAPLVGRLGPGELRLTQDGRVKALFIDGGFAQIRGNVVTVLTNKAVAADTITAEGAASALEAAVALPATNDPERTLRNAAIARATAMKRLAAKPKEWKNPLADRV